MNSSDWKRLIKMDFPVFFFLFSDIELKNCYFFNDFLFSAIILVNVVMVTLILLISKKLIGLIFNQSIAVYICGTTKTRRFSGSTNSGPMQITHFKHIELIEETTSGPENLLELEPSVKTLRIQPDQPLMVSAVLQVQLPTSLATVHWYSPTSAASHLWTSSPTVPSSWEKLCFALGLISFESLCHVISNGPVPATWQEKLEPEPWTTLARDASLMNTGGSGVRKNNRHFTLLKSQHRLCQDFQDFMEAGFPL